jgi:hypothetical protein
MPSRPAQPEFTAEAAGALSAAAQASAKLALTLWDDLILPDMQQVLKFFSTNRFKLLLVKQPCNCHALIGLFSCVLEAYVPSTYLHMLSDWCLHRNT